MNFFEQELHKILDGTFKDRTTYIGRKAFIKIAKDTIAEVRFYPTVGITDYDSINVEVVNTRHGFISSLVLQFEDILERDPKSKLICGNRWGYRWYDKQPSTEGYAALADSIKAYLELFNNGDDE